MKDLYKIHEIAKLFGLHPDTLRYYEEKGLLHPARGENGYRMYTIQDICTLNIIRSQRDLGVPVEEIGDYLKRRSVGETLAFLDAEEALLEQRIAVLETARGEARERRARLTKYSGVEAGRVSCLRLEERPFVFLQEDVILEREVDFLLKKLEKRHQDSIKIIGRQTMGAIVDGESLRKGVFNHFSCVFFLTGPGSPHDEVLPAGEYASLFYRGAYDRLEEHHRELLEGIAGLGAAPDGLPLELYHIDAHDTNREEEYLTELQVKVKRPG